ncbi:hypothetical protein [Microcoleus sp. CAWBG58]|uniref:hypothetical protein n=1 Tax=Microcoleus sp. CAWBG58 TaxID=2841651 RepID=UPI0025EFAB46|nr:hypothetical protein [Microcoleus sp. CAWBG58]
MLWGIGLPRASGIGLPRASGIGLPRASSIGLPRASGIGPKSMNLPTVNCQLSTLN